MWVIWSFPGIARRSLWQPCSKCPLAPSTLVQFPLPLCYLSHRCLLQILRMPCHQLRIWACLALGFLWSILMALCLRRAIPLALLSAFQPPFWNPLMPLPPLYSLPSQRSPSTARQPQTYSMNPPLSTSMTLRTHKKSASTSHTQRLISNTFSPPSLVFQVKPNATWGVTSAGKYLFNSTASLSNSHLFQSRARLYQAGQDHHQWTLDPSSSYCVTPFSK